VFTPGIAAPQPLWLRSPKTEARPADQLGREGMIDAGLVGGDARITIRRESPDDVGFREIFVSMDGQQIAILKHQDTFTLEVAPGPKFVAINKAGFGTFGFMTFLGASPLYLTFERDNR
jgi:hypothetical protein